MLRQGGAVCSLADMAARAKEGISRSFELHDIRRQIHGTEQPVDRHRDRRHGAERRRQACVGRRGAQEVGFGASKFVLKRRNVGESWYIEITSLTATVDVLPATDISRNVFGLKLALTRAST
jgi:hypothetical protein